MRGESMTEKNNIDQKIKEWSKPKTLRVGAIELRDVYHERLSPLFLDSKELHEYLVKRVKK